MDEKTIGVIIGSIITFVGVMISLRISRTNLQIQLDNQTSNLKLQLDHQVNRENLKIRLEKLEELHGLLMSVGLSNAIILNLSMTGGFNDEEKKAHFNRIEKAIEETTRTATLIEVYEPSLTPKFDKLQEAYRNVNQTILVLTEQNHQLDSVPKKIEEVNLLCSELMKDIALKANQLTKIEKPSIINNKS